MFPGFFVGTLFLFMLGRTVFGGHRYGFRRRWAGHAPWGARYAPEPTEWLWGDDPWADRPRRVATTFDPVAAPAGSRVEEAMHKFLRSLRDKLGASPEQERAFATAIGRLREATGDFQTHMSDARDHLARAVRSDGFDEPAFEAASRRMDAGVEAMRAAVRQALVDVHDVLEPRQREMLARLIESR